MKTRVVNCANAAGRGFFARSLPWSATRILRWLFVLAVGGVGVASYGRPAAELRQGKFTQVINQVGVQKPGTGTVRSAKVNDLLEVPEVVRTGGNSRAELTAADGTIVRVGANAVFSLETQGRSLRLEQGSLLFHAPTGRGGGTIKTSGASASVLGTSLIVSATKDGGFKTILLEGKGRVLLPNGKSRSLHAGQLVFVLGGIGEFGPVLDIHLGRLVQGSGLLKGFETDLPSRGKIEREVQRQDRKLEKGEAEDTGVLVGEYAAGGEAGVKDASVLDRVFGDEYITGLKEALQLDATVTAAGLNPSQVFLETFDLQLQGFPFDDYFGFAARNISFHTSLVDLRPYEGADPPYFDMVAAHDVSFPQSVTFLAGSSLPLFITAIDQFHFAPATALRYDNPGGLHLVSRLTAEFPQNVFENNLGLIWLQSTSGGLSLNSGGVVADEVKLYASGSLLVDNSTLAGRRLVKLETVSNQLAPKTGDFSTVGLPFDPADVEGNIFLRQSTISGSQPGGGELWIRAANICGLDNVTLNNIAAIALDARTLNLEAVTFPNGSTVLLRSEFGLLAPNPNSGAASVPGFVNFIRNVNYGSAPAQNAIGSGITLAPWPASPQLP